MTVPPVPAPRILVTDPEQRAALAAVRSLGRRGWLIETVGVSRGLAGASRYARGHHPVNAADAADAERYRRAVQQAVLSAGSSVVVPVTDAASRMLLGHDTQLGARIAGPTAAAYERASNKESLLQAAARVGLRVPAQVVLASPPTQKVALPPFARLVVKPARSVVEVEGRTIRVGVRFCADTSLLPTLLSQYPAEAYPLLLQERVEGDGLGVFLLRRAGVTLLRFGHRRLREKPPAGGVSTYREAWQPPERLVNRCEALLDALGYEGAAMIEFKQDASSGEAVLMEINARLWGSVQLAVDAGVDFPAALVELALGLPVHVAASACSGVRSVWELGELDHAIAIARRSPAALDLPPGTATGLLAAARAILDHRASDHLEVFRLSDPMPFFAELRRWLLRR